MRYTRVLTLLAALFSTSGISAIVKRNADDSPQQCSYSFDVPASADDTCPSSAPSIGNLTALEATISTQYAGLDDKLNEILAGLGLDGSSTETGSGDASPSGGGGVNYKRWGRTTCPDTATLIYAGEDRYSNKSHHNICNDFSRNYCNAHKAWQHVVGWPDNTTGHL